jgi:hypothetical protein
MCVEVFFMFFLIRQMLWCSFLAIKRHSMELLHFIVSCTSGHKLLSVYSFRLEKVFPSIFHLGNKARFSSLSAHFTCRLIISLVPHFDPFPHLKIVNPNVYYTHLKSYCIFSKLHGKKRLFTISPLKTKRVCFI